MKTGELITEKARELYPFNLAQRSAFIKGANFYKFISKKTPEVNDYAV